VLRTVIDLQGKDIADEKHQGEDIGENKAEPIGTQGHQFQPGHLQTDAGPGFNTDDAE